MGAPIYYNLNKPQLNSNQARSIISDVLDSFISQALAGVTPPALDFFLQNVGTFSSQQTIEEQVTFGLNNNQSPIAIFDNIQYQLLVDGSGAALASAIAQKLLGQVPAGASILALGKASAVGLAASIIWEAGLEDVVSGTFDFVFRRQNVDIQLLSGTNGTLKGGVLYDANVSNPIEAVGTLIERPSSTAIAGNVVTFRTDGFLGVNKDYTLLNGQLLSKIANVYGSGPGTATDGRGAIGTWGWAKDAAGNSVSNDALIYERGGLTILEKEAKLALRVFDGEFGGDWKDITVDARDVAIGSGNTANGGFTINGYQVILGTSGIDTLSANGSATTTTYVIAGAGYDNVQGSAGSDHILLEESSVYGSNMGSSVNLAHGYGGNDYIYGGGSVDTIYGGAGNDRLVGGKGSDKIEGGEGDDSIFGDTQVENILTPEVASDLLIGGGGKDIINGEEGDDILIGGKYELTESGFDPKKDATKIVGDEVIDRLNGGAGFDTYYISRAEDLFFRDWVEADITGINAQLDRIADSDGKGQIIELNFGGTQTVIPRLVFKDAFEASWDYVARDETGREYFTLDVGGGGIAIGGHDGDVSFVIEGVGAPVLPQGQQLGLSLEAAPFAAASAATPALSPVVLGFKFTPLMNQVVGDNNAQSLTGTAAHDYVQGFAGNDTISGLQGHDAIEAGDGNDTVYGGDGDDDIYGEAGSDILNGDAGDDYIFGGIGADNLVGGAGADRLDGGTEADQMSGGDGDDTYYIDNLNDTVIETNILPSGGSDLVVVNVSGLTSYTLGSGLENIEVTHSGTFSIFGNALNNVIKGSYSNDIVQGGLGDDTIYGFAGSDQIDGGGGLDTVVFRLRAVDYVFTQIDSTHATVTTVPYYGAQTTTLVNVENVVFAENFVPVARDDTGFVTLLDTPITISRRDMLQNDYDIDLRDSKSISSLSDAVNCSVILDALGDIVVTPLQGYSGPASFKYTIQDGQGGFDTATVSIQVQAATEDEAFIFNLPTDSFSDLPYLFGVSYSATLSTGAALPSWLVFDTGNTFDRSTMTFTGTPPQNFNGSVDVQVTASTGTVSATETLKLTIKPVNDAPVVAALLADRTSAEDTAVSFTLPAGSFTDVDNATLTYSTTLSTGSALPAWLSFNAATQTFTGTPPANFNGSIDVRVTASDGSLSASDVFALTITPVNDAPVVAVLLADRTSAEDTAVSFTLPAGSFTDIDNATLTYSATLSTGAALPAWLSFNATNQTFTGTPPANFNGSIDVRVTASDGTLSASDIFALTITPVNDAPIATADVGLSTPFNTALTILPGSLLANDTDVDNDSLVISAVSNPVNGTVTIAANGSVVFTPTSGFSGSASFSYTVSDGKGGTGSGAVSLTVQAGQTTNVINGTAGADTLTGTAGADTINGLAGDDTLNGGAGVDTLVGGLGNDIYVVDSTTDIITEAASAGTDTVQSSVTITTLAANVENLTLTGTVAINGTGNALNNTLTGNSANNTLNGGDGDDTLNGGAGTDTLVGGLGNDIYIVDSTTDIITEAASAGTDTVQSSVTIATLATNVENLTLTGTAAINGTGNALANVITGNSANNTLNGGAGNDTLIGGAGVDTLVLTGLRSNYSFVAINGTQVTVTDSVAGRDGVETIAEIENIQFSDGTFTLASLLGSGQTINGTTGNDNLVGTSGNDTINGLAGDDTLDGGGGVDTLVGGLGQDIYVVDSTTDIITELFDEGFDTVRSSVTVTTLAANVENLTLTGTAAINGTGNALGNNITGNSANNTLNGGDGLDTLIGGLGSDTLDGGAGSDYASYQNATAAVGVHLGDPFVNYGEASGDTYLSIENLIGSSFDDELIGDIGNNVIFAGAGADTIVGSDGDDVLSGDNGNDALYGGNGIDSMYGDSGDDSLFGDDGNDFLDGGLANDYLVGGAGSDRFYFAAGYGADVIADFAAGPGIGDEVRISLGTAFDTFAEVLAAASQSGSDTVITFGTGTSITLTGVSKSNLTVDDFSFS
jgi:Ca2+-binding RTX toxin-like protein